MPFYAIRMLDHKTVNIVKKTWPECSAITKGHSAEFKKFNTLQEVENYFNENKKLMTEEEAWKIKDAVIYYIDGSSKNGMIGWGVIGLQNGVEIMRDNGSISPTTETSANITGELHAAKIAMMDAKINGYKEIYIVHDYQGIAAYVSGAWTARQKSSREYILFYKNICKDVKVNFIQLKGHTNNKYNDIADELAKAGTLL